MKCQFVVILPLRVIKYNGQCVNKYKMNPHHHHELCKLPRITHLSEDFGLSARMCYTDENKYEEDLKIIRDEAAEIDDFLDMYNERQDNDFNGIVVSISKGRPIIFVIDNQMSCCEKVGVNIACPEGLSRDDFIGAMITNVKWGREGRDEDMDYSFSEIIIETTIGNLTLTAFNEHNGYYSHDVIACFNDEIEHFRL